MEKCCEIFPHVRLDQIYFGLIAKQQPDLHDVPAILLSLARMAALLESFEFEYEKVFQAGGTDPLDLKRMSGDLVVGNDQLVEPFDVDVELYALDDHLMFGQARVGGDFFHVFQDSVVDEGNHEIRIMAGFEGDDPAARGVQVHRYSSDEDNVGEVVTECRAEIQDLGKGWHGWYYTLRVTKMLPAIFPNVSIMAKVPRGSRSTVQSLCRAAGIECRVTGPAAERRVYLNVGKLKAAREPGSYGHVSLGIPGGDKKKRAILALGLLAYTVFDYAARESMRGRPESKQAFPLGRPRKVLVLDGAERQRRWRAAQAVKAVYYSGDDITAAKTRPSRSSG